MPLRCNRPSLSIASSDGWRRDARATVMRATPLLREVQHLRAVREHRRCLADVDPPLVHFGDVGYEDGLDAPRPLHQLREATEQLVIGKALQLVRARHDD